MSGIESVLCVYIKVYMKVYVIYFYLQHTIHMPGGQFQTFPEEEPSSFMTECCFKAPTTVPSVTSLLSFGLELGLTYSK